MKRLYYLLLVLPVLALMAACSDDDKDLPKVNITADYADAEMINDVLTVTQGQPLKIEKLTVTPVEGTKKAMLGNVVYYIDGLPVGSTGVSPYSAEFSTENLAEGTHTLGIVAQVFQVDREPGFAVGSISFAVTADGINPGTGTLPFTSTVSADSK